MGVTLVGGRVVAVGESLVGWESGSSGCDLGGVGEW